MLGNGYFFKTKDNKTAATLEVNQSNYRSQVIRSSYCSALIKDKSVCLKCEEAKKYAKNKLSTKKDCCEQPQGRYDQMTEKELLKKLRSKRSEEIKKNNVARYYLKKKRSEMITVAPESSLDLMKIFDDLKEAIEEREQKVQSPLCQWDGCFHEAKDVEQLLVHAYKHIKTDSKEIPLNRSYKCHWDDCTFTFHKVKALKNHLRNHTGSESDHFFKILLQDQAKALTCRSLKGMRWHPAVIKFCLRLWCMMTCANQGF